MRLGWAFVVVALLLLSGGVVLGAPGVATAHPTPAATGSLVGNITGPTVLGYNTNHYYTINGTGGPAYAANGTLIGNVTFFASITAENLTGVSITPSESAITNCWWRTARTCSTRAASWWLRGSAGCATRV